MEYVLKGPDNLSSIICFVKTAPNEQSHYQFPFPGRIFMLMKKTLAFLVLILYFTVSTGFVVSLHYCMDRLDSTELGQSKQDKCPKCGMHKSDGCCHDEVKVVKLQLAHISSSLFHQAFTAPEAVAVETGFILTPFTNYTGYPSVIDSGPPLSHQDVYVRNRVFRI